MKFLAVIAIAIIVVVASLAMVDATPVLDRRAQSGREDAYRDEIRFRNEIVAETDPRLFNLYKELIAATSDGNKILAALCGIRVALETLRTERNEEIALLEDILRN